MLDEYPKQKKKKVPEETKTNTAFFAADSIIFLSAAGNSADSPTFFRTGNQDCSGICCRNRNHSGNRIRNYPGNRI